MTTNELEIICRQIIYTSWDVYEDGPELIAEFGDCKIVKRLALNLTWQLIHGDDELYLVNLDVELAKEFFKGGKADKPLPWRYWY